MWQVKVVPSGSSPTGNHRVPSNLLVKSRTYALSRSRPDLAGCGTRTTNQLGIPHRTPYVALPQKRNNMEEISMEKARAGSSHTVHLRQVALLRPLSHQNPEPTQIRLHRSNRSAHPGDLSQPSRREDTSGHPATGQESRHAALGAEEACSRIGLGANQRAALERGGVRRFWPGMRG